MALTESQIERYSRHIILSQMGGVGQEKLLASKVLIIGAGGLGAPIALYLAAAGVGTLGLIDPDCVEISNLQRQVIHFTPDIGKPKVLSAKEKIEQINPDVKVVTYQDSVLSGNTLDVMASYDFIVDGTDNFEAKFLINDACVMAKKPFSHGGILRFDGQTMTYVPGHACYRCVFHAPPPKGAVPTCSQAGVLGAVAGMLGTMQASECVKYLIGQGELLVNRLLIFNALDMTFRTARFARKATCPVCGDHPTITQLIDDQPPTCDLKTSEGKR